jgi:NAD/NADP transhydrogenase alpha subunit
MKIADAKEIDRSEPRVAASPDTVKKFKTLGVAIEPGAGIKSGLPDSEFAAVGATVSADVVKDADIVIKVTRSEASELARYKRGALIIGRQARAVPCFGRVVLDWCGLRRRWQCGEPAVTVVFNPRR